MKKFTPADLEHAIRVNCTRLSVTYTLNDFEVKIGRARPKPTAARLDPALVVKLTPQKPERRPVTRGMTPMEKFKARHPQYA